MCTRKRFASIIAGFTIGLTLASGAAHAADTLTPQQISEELVGKTLVGRNNLSGDKPSRPVVLQFKPDGTMDLEVQTQRGIWTDSGRWHLSDTGYCVTWDKFQSGQERCNTVQSDGGAYRTVHKDGTPSMELRVR
ncbi:MAG: hypothetical protein KGL51_03525 [Betaproteobacteria bacterium]|nr:hypothetical protein [Betaproteobacteria bacterium]MDE2122708.1 hypothetical protein [Betaproteobacteria bacterium]MDE2186741.1 hypothetical protein [Betaproteobacteria bacterium]MDE2323729.1 hypothetical protein [Betaproteobacteria bacterium]